MAYQACWEAQNKARKVNQTLVSRARTVDTVLDFAEASQRFRSHAPPGQPNNGDGTWLR